MSKISPPNSGCRMYEARFPEVDIPVMIQVKEILDVATHVALLEYNNIEGMIMLSDLSRRRIRSVGGLLKVGRIEPAIVLRVDADKGYIDLSKKQLTEEDKQVCEERYAKSKLVHSIMRHVSETMKIDLEDLYIHVGWPLYRKYGHAFEAFKCIVNDPDSVLKPLTRELRTIGADGRQVIKVVPAISEEVKEALVRKIRRQMTPKPVNLCAYIEMTCFEYDGVFHIKEAMRKAEAVSTKECPVKMKLVAAPLYVIITLTLAKEQGIKILNQAAAACMNSIEGHRGKLIIKESPRAVSEQGDKLLTEQKAYSELQKAEVSRDEDSGGEEDTGMGLVDLESISSFGIED
uniref:eukaryotic translation initiation factor 2 subunit alpha homolog n=1 Tax=Erigeron canadensis TaxID=72917 RepID=UPI001CB8A34F|nr:eukaryotic translation initiation factor 2 subunit alpha homolog [Erigeron canadensis]